MRTTHNIFVNATGAYGNIGDAVIRRRVIDWTRDPAHGLHIYVGNAPDEWVEQLRIGPTDTLYRATDRPRWLRRLLIGGGRTPRALVLDPGEVNLSRPSLPLELFWLVMTVALRIRRVPVIRPPRGAAQETRLTLALHRLACRASTATYWRDAPSAGVVGMGSVVPDTAFQDPPSDPGTGARTRLVVSLRAARAMVGPAWIKAVNDFAAEYGLTVVLASQVRSDETRCAELAAETGWDHWEWTPDQSASDREAELRALYDESLLVLSDRLHVLILAATAGAVPLELVDTPKDKIRRTFAQVGIDNVSVDAANMDSSSLCNVLIEAVGPGAGHQDALALARERVDQVQRATTAQIVDSGPRTRHEPGPAKDRWSVARRAAHHLRHPHRPLHAGVPMLKSLLWPIVSRARIWGEFWRDQQRYIRWSAPSGGRRYAEMSDAHLEGHITKQYHRIEKGLSLPEPRRPFGAAVKSSLETLLASPGSEQRSGHYWSPTEEALTALDSWNESGHIADAVSPASPRESVGPDLDPADLEAFFKSRHSVRDFEPGAVVDPEDIRLAVELASTTPSVCNRQTWRAHLYQDANQMRDVLSHQSGNAGFGHLAAGIFVVTSDVRYFSGSGERNQPGVDGGMFAMSLVLALHGRGISTCMLNWSKGNAASDALRETAGIPDHETVIALIAFGHARKGHRVARSSRRPFEQVLHIHP